MQTHAYMQQNSVHPLTLSKILMQIRKVEVNYFEHSYGNGFLNCKLDYWSLVLFGLDCLDLLVIVLCVSFLLAWHLPSQSLFSICRVCMHYCRIIMVSVRMGQFYFHRHPTKSQAQWHLRWACSNKRTLIECIELTIHICNAETIYLERLSPIARCGFEAPSAWHHSDPGDCGGSQGCAPGQT